MPSEIQTPIVRGDREGKTIEILGGRLTYKVLSDETEGAYAIIDQEVPPGHGPPLHVHRRETEIFYVAAGTFDVQCGNEVHRLDAGIALCGAARHSASLRECRRSPGRLVLTVFPGNFANYFLEVADIPPDDEEQMMDILAKYEVELVDGDNPSED